MQAWFQASAAVSCRIRSPLELYVPAASDNDCDSHCSALSQRLQLRQAYGTMCHLCTVIWYMVPPVSSFFVILLVSLLHSLSVSSILFGLCISASMRQALNLGCCEYVGCVGGGFLVIGVCVVLGVLCGGSAFNGNRDRINSCDQNSFLSWLQSWSVAAHMV